MYYDTELNFLCSLMKNLHLPVNIIEYPTSEPPELDFGSAQNVIQRTGLSENTVSVRGTFERKHGISDQRRIFVQLSSFCASRDNALQIPRDRSFYLSTEITEQMVLKN